MNQQGYSGYYDSSTADAMSGFEFENMGGLISENQRPLPYVPDLLPVGSGSTYFPRSVDDDAVALNVLGFGAGFPGGGVSLSSDQARAEGAWDATFQAAVKRFQGTRGLKQDGWIGPATRTQLAAAVATFNASPAGRPAVSPPNLVLPAPGLPSLPVLPSGGGPAPPPGAAAEDNTLRNVGIGAGVLVLLVGGYYLLT